MLKIFSREPTPIDEQIDAVILAMSNVDPTTPEYTKLVGDLTALNEIKTSTGRKPVSSDTIFATVGSFGIGLMVVLVEKTHITNSKVWAMVTRQKH